MTLFGSVAGSALWFQRDVSSSYQCLGYGNNAIEVSYVDVR